MTPQPEHSNAPYDLAVIGGGSGGVRAARTAAALGKRVCLIESQELGGTCVHRGCVPKKLFVYASRMTESFFDAAAYGWSLKTTEPTFSWKTLVANKDAELARLEAIYQAGQDRAGVEVIHGYGRFVSASSVAVAMNDGSGTRTVRAARFLITVGGTPDPVDIPGKEFAVSSDALFHLKTLPKRIVIAGGGYIGVEFACLFALLGVEVHLVHRRERLLRGFDEETAEFLGEQVRLHGVHLHLNRSIIALKKDDATNDVRAILDDGTELPADLHVSATGRKGNTDNLGLEHAGVAMGNRGSIIVDDSYQTNVPGIFALGDVIARLQLTPVAIAEAIAFVSAEFEGVQKPVDYVNVPTAVFSTPTLATVGLTEEQAWSHGYMVKVFSSSFRPMKQTLPGRAGRAFMKLVVDCETDRVLGAHMVGPDAAEIMQGLAVAIRCGAKKSDLDQTIGIHPSSAEEFVQMRTPTRSARRSGQ